MTDTESNRPPPARDALDRYLALDAGDELDTDGHSSGHDRGRGRDSNSVSVHDDIELHARCDAAMALAPKLRESADFAWAFDDARLLARGAPAARDLHRTPDAPGSSGPLAWYQRPVLAWSTAAVMTCVALLLAVLPTLQGPIAPATPTPAATRFTFAPIIVPRVTSAQLDALTEVDPVVLIANQVAVDGRSIAVLPFSTTDDSTELNATADMIYRRLLQQLTAMPGLYVIDPGIASSYADTALTAEQIAQYLSVRGIVEGRVASDGERIMLDLTFTDAARDNYSASYTFAWDIDVIAESQLELASTVLDALGDAPPLAL